MKRRTFRIIACAIAIVVAALGITVLCVVSHFRSLGSERNTPVDCHTFITPDASCALLLKWDLADKGIGDFSAPLIAAYDERRQKAAGFWERQSYFLLGFDKPSDAITRTLPAEGAFIVRYDPEQSRFHSSATVSVSGLAGLLKKAAARIPSLATNPGVTLEEREYKGERLFVAQNGAGPPSATLAARDFSAVFAPLEPPGGCWSVVDNNLLLARRADSLTTLVDRLRSGAEAKPQASPLAALIPKTTNGVDASGILLNQHGELAALIEFAAQTMRSKVLDHWLAAEREQAYADMATIKEVTVAVNVHPGDRITATFRVKFTDLAALTRVLMVLDAAFKEIEPPPPIKFVALPNFSFDGVGLHLTATGVREYLRREIAGDSP